MKMLAPGSAFGSAAPPGRPAKDGPRMADPVEPLVTPIPGDDAGILGEVVAVPRRV
jgi:hypothetical protein